MRTYGLILLIKPLGSGLEAKLTPLHDGSIVQSQELENNCDSTLMLQPVGHGGLKKTSEREELVMSAKYLACYEAKQHELWCREEKGEYKGKEKVILSCSWSNGEMSAESLTTHTHPSKAMIHPQSRGLLPRPLQPEAAASE